MPWGCSCSDAMKKGREADQADCGRGSGLTTELRAPRLGLLLGDPSPDLIRDEAASASDLPAREITTRSGLGHEALRHLDEGGNLHPRHQRRNAWNTRR